MFKSPNKRSANFVKRAAFNFMRHLPPRLCNEAALAERARKSIGETAEFFKKPKNRLHPLDLWYRFLYGVAGVEGCHNRLVAFEGRSVTTIVSQGLPDGAMIANLLDLYTREEMKLEAD